MLDGMVSLKQEDFVQIVGIFLAGWAVVWLIIRDFRRAVDSDFRCAVDSPLLLNHCSNNSDSPRTQQALAKKLGDINHDEDNDADNEAETEYEEDGDFSDSDEDDDDEAAANAARGFLDRLRPPPPSCEPPPPAWMIVKEGPATSPF
jgi:hypothetical protein